jgi:hypothetical protein
MKKYFLCTLLSFVSCISAPSAFAIDLSTYVNQDQHTSFFVFGNGGESIISHCYFSYSPSYGRCHFTLKADQVNEMNINLDYDSLKDAQPILLAKIKSLRSEWKKNYPVTKINQYIFLFRQNDHDSLDQLVKELEQETLSYRVLMKKIPRDGVTIFSGELTERIFEAFIESLEPLRFK